MKSLKLITLFIALSTAGFSQSKSSPDTVKTKESDANRLFTLPLRLTESQIQLLVASPDEWKSIHASNRLTGEQITVLDEQAAELRKNIKQYFLALKQFSDTVKTTPKKIKNK